VTDDLDDLGLPPAANFTVQTVHEVQTTAYKLPSPALITDAVGPKVLLVERRVGRDRVAHEAVGSVRVHAKQERNEEVVGVPESLERLLSNSVMGRGVDEQHAKQHDMSSDATSFGVVNLQSNLGAHLGSLNIEEARNVSFPSRRLGY
jgi:signal transduction histidine kinase